MNDMDLPTGKTCADCCHLRRCVGMGFTKAENTNCDFSPSRFVEKLVIPNTKIPAERPMLVSVSDMLEKIGVEFGVRKGGKT